MISKGDINHMYANYTHTQDIEEKEPKNQHLHQQCIFKNFLLAGMLIGHSGCNPYIYMA